MDAQALPITNAIPLNHVLSVLFDSTRYLTIKIARDYRYYPIQAGDSGVLLVDGKIRIGVVSCPPVISVRGKTSSNWWCNAAKVLQPRLDFENWTVLIFGQANYTLMPAVELPNGFIKETRHFCRVFRTEELKDKPRVRIRGVGVLGYSWLPETCLTVENVNNLLAGKPLYEKMFLRKTGV